jgi:outer membrane lipoprotein-sorting protein
MRSLRIVPAILAGLLGSAAAFGQGSSTPEAIVRQSQQAFFYAGKDLKARVHMRLIARDGKERLRELVMLRKDIQEGGEQKYFIYFQQPSDVRDMTFMVWKYPGRDDDRWLYMPALKLVRRVAANDKRSSFAGSDFTYEDISGRDLEEDTYELAREESLNGKGCDVVKSTPKTEKGADYSYRLSWVERASRLPLKEEFYDRQGKLAKVFTADEAQEVQGIPTVVRRSMANLQTGHRTEVVFAEVRYDLGLPDDLFTERYLRNAPAEWVK